MKIFIHTDLEGATNVNSMEMVDFENPLNGYAYQNLIDDVNSAIDGIFVAGATTVTILDNHGGGDGIDPSLLDKRAEYDYRKSNKWWGKLDETYDASLFIGAHAMAGTMNAFLDHTMMSSKWYNYLINNKPHGELGLWAAVCGNFNLPLIMVSGDEAACAEARNFLGDIETVAVKQGIGRNKCHLYDTQKCRQKIREKAYNAVKNIHKYKVYKPLLPAEVILEMCRADFADEKILSDSNIDRVDARTIRKYANNYLELLI